MSTMFYVTLLGMGILALLLGMFVLFIGLKRRKRQYVIAGAIGILFSVIGIFNVWIYKLH